MPGCRAIHRVLAVILVAIATEAVLPPAMSGPQAVAPAAAPAPSAPDATSWTPCTWDPQKDDALAECATVLVPADPADPSRGDFRLGVKRRRVIGRPSGQVWILHGGPGASSTEGLKRLTFEIPERRPDIAFYAVDHRGVGGSEKLECPEQQAAGSDKGSWITPQEWPACLAHVKATWGDRLDLFTTTHAARDVGALVEHYRIPGVPVFIYGGSYGTYLARRYLALFPDQPRGVILEGIAAARDHMTGYDAAMIRAAGDLLAACGRSPDCGPRFDGPPGDAIRRTLASLDAGHCPDLHLTTADAKMLLTGMTFTATTRVLVPALARRIGRCSASDVAVIGRALTTYLGTLGGKGYSSVLHNHVALSEMYTPAQGAEALQAQFDAAALSTGLELGYSKLQPAWPVYRRDPFVGSEPDYRGPLLMLQGGLDTPSPLERALPVRDRFRGRRQYWVQFPEGAHGMTGRTPTRDGGDCARSIYLRFLERPDKAPDTACLARILPIAWNSTPEDALRFMGTLDIWDGRLESADEPIRPGNP